MQKIKKTIPLFSFLFIVLSGCSSFQRSVELAPNAELNIEKLSGHQKEVIILGINDFHGFLDPVTHKTKLNLNDTNEIEYQTGGAEILSSHIQLQRKKHGRNLIVVDAGDQFQGTIESNTFFGAPVVQFFNAIGMNAAAVGNHEYDYGQAELVKRMQEAQYLYLTANTFLKKNKKFPNFPNTKPSTIIDTGNVKVGLIGLSTLDTPFTTRAEHVADLEFTDLVQATLTEREKLLKQGAELIVVVAHVGTRCRDFHPHGNQIHSQEDSFVDCDEKGELTQFIKKMPVGKIDAIVAGHTHTLLHHYIEGIPVIQAGAYNRYYNLVRLVYDSKSKKSIPSFSKIEGPFPVCKKIFSNQKDCDGDRTPPPEGRGNLVTPKLYGETIEPDSAIMNLLESYREKTDALKKTVVGHASRPLTHDRRSESELGNLMADALVWKSNADFALVNPGGIRAPISSGKIYYEDVYRSFPFDNRLSILKITGKELKLILQIAQNGSRGWFSVGNLALDLINLDKPGKIKDLNRNGKHENWETNRLKQIRELKTGKKIDDRRMYTLATLDFLVTGGDGLGWAMKQIPESRIQLDAGITVRDALVEYLKTKNTVNSSTDPAVNPESRRIRIVVK